MVATLLPEAEVECWMDPSNELSLRSIVPSLSTSMVAVQNNSSAIVQSSKADAVNST